MCAHIVYVKCLRCCSESFASWQSPRSRHPEFAGGGCCSLKVYSFLGTSPDGCFLERLRLACPVLAAVCRYLGASVLLCGMDAVGWRSKWDALCDGEERKEMMRDRREALWSCYGWDVWHPVAEGADGVQLCQYELCHPAGMTKGFSLGSWTLSGENIKVREIVLGWDVKRTCVCA